MTIECHSVMKYTTGSRLAVSHATDQMQVEMWRHEAGRLPDLHLQATEVAVLLAGRLSVERKGNGRYQRSVAQPGTFWLCPAGTYETDISLSGAMEETVHIFLPPDLLCRTALEEYEIDPSNIALDYAGGAHDPLLNQIALSFQAMRERPGDALNRLMSDSLRVTLAAHLLRNYLSSPEQRTRSAHTLHGKIDMKRLQRVLDMVEANPQADFSLRELADEACLSPFHFSRAFHNTTGLSPFQYVTERRIEKARAALMSSDRSLSQISADVGFATQASFTRAFKRSAGVTPGQFREAYGRSAR